MEPFPPIPQVSCTGKISSLYNCSSHRAPSTVHFHCSACINCQLLSKKTLFYLTYIPNFVTLGMHSINIFWVSDLPNLLLKSPFKQREWSREVVLCFSDELSWQRASLLGSVSSGVTFLSCGSSLVILTTNQFALIHSQVQANNGARHHGICSIINKVTNMLSP